LRSLLIIDIFLSEVSFIYWCFSYVFLFCRWSYHSYPYDYGSNFSSNYHGSSEGHILEKQEKFCNIIKISTNNKATFDETSVRAFGSGQEEKLLPTRNYIHLWFKNQIKMQKHKLMSLSSASFPFLVHVHSPNASVVVTSLGPIQRIFLKNNEVRYQIPVFWQELWILIVISILNFIKVYLLLMDKGVIISSSFSYG